MTKREADRLCELILKLDSEELRMLWHGTHPVEVLMATELSEDGRTRLLRRYRKLDGEARAVAKRMWEHAMAVEWDRQWVQRDLASAKQWGEGLASENQRLRERCSMLYNLLSPEQRELTRTNGGKANG